MKKISSSLPRLLVAASLVLAVSCNPNGDGNSTDTKNSDGEGAVDSTRLPGFGSDSTTISDTSGAADTTGNR